MASVAQLDKSLGILTLLPWRATNLPWTLKNTEFWSGIEVSITKLMFFDTKENYS